MIGVAANAIAVLIGGIVGIVARKVIPESWNDIIIRGLGLCSIYIGISGALEGENTLLMIISIVVGAMIGEGLRIEQRFNAAADRIEKKMDSKGGKSNFAQAFVTSSLVMCVGAMTIVGSLNAGLQGNNTLLFTKTALDGVAAIIFAASMGFGVLFAIGPIIVIEGGIVLLAQGIAPVLTDSVITEMTCVGSLLIMALGINMSTGTKLKVMNYMPAIVIPIGLCPLYDWILSVI